ncbi:MAG: hypothetical protein H7066_10190 [Cytophagaceae bacterium]|nr:hypothetical protein [Gemmatimonadaceae bacterium]
MLTRVRLGAAVAACVLLSGCYHQVVSTGLAPGATTVKKPWTSTWVFGLIEAKPINVRAECPGGVALVASKFTVLNWLGAAVTLGIWVPWDVTVTCAGGRASLDASTLQVPLGQSPAASLALAAQMSREHGAPVAVVWETSSTTQSEVSR